MKTVSSGISLVEVILSVLIFGIVVTSLLGLQGTLVRGVFSGHAFIERIGFIRSYFVSIERDRLSDQKDVSGKNFEDPRMTISYRQQKPTSALSSFSYLTIDHFDVRWPSFKREHLEQFARIRFNPKNEDQQ